MEQQSEYLTIEAVAELLKVGVPTVQGLIDRGLLASELQGARMLVPYASVLAFLREDQRILLDQQGEQPEP
jgi:excisionase family DNA binding protein